MNKLKLIFTVLLFVPLGMVGCTSEQEKQEKRLNEYARTTERSLNRLESHIKAGYIPNTAILAKYATQVKKQKPDLGDLIDHLAKDSTSGKQKSKDSTSENKKSKDSTSEKTNQRSMQVKKSKGIDK